MQHTTIFARSATLLVATALLAVTAAPGLAAQPTAVAPNSKEMNGSTTITVNKHVIVVKGRLSLGLLNGEASELVYDTSDGSKVSELKWQLNNVPMLGIGGSIIPFPWLTVNADVWFNLSSDNSEMDDYDWLISGMGWSDWSHHDDTSIDHATMIDINAEIPVLKRNKTTVYGIVGYKRDKFEWSARGGTFVYSVYGFRDYTGSFQDGVEVISYEQTYNTPYIGIGFTANLTPITLSGRLIGSTLVDVDDQDHHKLRNLIFDDDFETGNMIGVDLSATYDYTSRLHFIAGFHYQEYGEVKGSTTVTDTTTGAQQTFNGDAAGADNYVDMFTLSVVYDL